MSWLKLNDSLNKVKGQITSFAQEVLAEGIVEEQEDEDPNRNPVRELDEAREKIGELTGLCATQDQEIATLRKQIVEYQQQQRNQSKSPTELPPPSGSKLVQDPHGPGTSTAVAAATTAPSAASALEDSWFWDPEQNVSSTSSSSKKDDENDSPRSGTDLTTIPLEAPASEGEIIERLHRQLGDIRHQLKKQQLENALLNEKLTQVSNENRELNENIEELDRQHELVVENLLGAKKGLLEKCTRLEEDLRVMHGEAAITQELEQLKVKYGKLEQSYVGSCQESVRLKSELQRIVVDNVDVVAGLEGEIEELKKSLAGAEDRLRRVLEEAEQRINIIVAEKAELDEQLVTLKDDNEQIRNNLEETRAKCQKLSEVEVEKANMKSELDEFKRKAEEEAFVALQKEDQTEIEDLRRKLDQMKSESERWKTDCDRLQEDNLELQKIEKDLQMKLQEHRDLLQAKEQQSVTESQVQQLQREVSELQNELKSVIIDNSVQMDAKEKEWQDKLNFLKAENSRIQHSKDTLEADLLEYEKECANLMKNNDMMIAEIENLKCKKLETINENAEDSIVILEKQLEDCSRLNKSLDDEYKEINKKLEEVLEEREELEMQVENYQKTLEEKTKNVKDLQLAMETLENEKSNLLFEINESKSRDTAPEDSSEIDAYKAETESLKFQLTTINEDHASLVLKLQQLQQNSVDNVKAFEGKLSEMRKSLEAKESVIKQLQEDLQRQTAELNTMQLSSESSVQEGLKIMQDRLEAESQKATVLAVEKDEIEAQLNLKLEELDKLNAELEEHSQVNTAKQAELSRTIETLTQQKDNLVQLITTKHNENVQYHAEIQRLSQLLQSELAAKNEPIPPTECQECPALREKLTSFESQIKKLEDFEKMADQIQFLREKSEILTNNLLIEQNNQKMLQQEKQEVLEQKNNLAKDLDRLRQHLLEVGEAHTQETVELQQRYEETQRKLQALEDEVKKSTNALTSASIRANQHAETLQAQYYLLQQQRDELVAKVNSADDRDHKNQASLTNLQCALEQFQINRDRDIELATAAIRKELGQSQSREAQLKGDIRQLQQQLADAKNGLLAAARISDQLEIAQVTVASLKEELAKGSEKYETLEGRLRATEASQADKVEKSLVKNLVIGYVVAPNQNDKHQILKLISAVLTMDQAECIKLGLNRSGGGWFHSILGSGNSPAAGAGNYNKESLTEAFVKFLEKESAPRPVNPTGSGLLNIMAHQSQPQQSQSTTSSSRTTTPTQRQQSLVDQNLNPVEPGAGSVPVPVQPILLGESTLLQQQTTFQAPRNSSSILKDILSDS
ncbi:girdin [Ochlerotatus camptorhynchus]|uniref:girdin n=1 Tax=Ochlerotatus camptorhynchus TaxID=644619 RepID=UPI0031E46222